MRPTMTNIVTSQWAATLGGAQITAAVLDRTVRHGRLITFRNESWRSNHALMLEEG